MEQDNNYNLRRRLFFIELYEDTTDYDIKEVLRIIKSYKKYAFIKHKPEGDATKEHYHVMLNLDNATTCTALSKKTGIPVKFLGKPVKSERSCLRYLTHKDDEDKIQYDLSDVCVSICYEQTLKRAYDDILTDFEIMSLIFAHIDSLKGTSIGTIIKDTLLWVNNNAFDTVYKKYRYEFDTYMRQAL